MDEAVRMMLSWSMGEKGTTSIRFVSHATKTASQELQVTTRKRGKYYAGIFYNNVWLAIWYSIIMPDWLFAIV